MQWSIYILISQAPSSGGRFFFFLFLSYFFCWWIQMGTYERERKKKTCKFEGYFQIYSTKIPLIYECTVSTPITTSYILIISSTMLQPFFQRLRICHLCRISNNLNTLHSIGKKKMMCDLLIFVPSRHLLLLFFFLFWKNEKQEGKKQMKRRTSLFFVSFFVLWLC